jgi:hypothetical protein
MRRFGTSSGVPARYLHATTLVIAIVATLLASGCAHHPPLSGEETCGIQGMILEGVALGTGSAVATDFSGNSVAVRSNSFGVSCRRTSTPEERCEVGAAQAAAGKKLSYDEGWRDLLLGAGYVAWILPGVILFIVFREQANTLAGEAEGEGQTALEDCLRATAARNRPRKQPSSEEPPAPPPAQPAPEAPAASVPAGCQYDTQCKGDRICRDGQCVAPTVPDAPPPRKYVDPFVQ